MTNLPSHNILDKTVDWVKSCSVDIMRYGKPLENHQHVMIARKVGVFHPERIRILIVDRIPIPVDVELLKIAAELNILGPGTVALTIGYGIFIRSGCASLRLLSHEFRHVYQYEKEGSIEAFLLEYIPQVIQFGYYNSPMEKDARNHEHL